MAMPGPVGPADYQNPAALSFARNQLQHAIGAGAFGQHGPTVATGPQALINQYHQLSPIIASFIQRHGPLVNPHPVPAPVPHAGGGYGSHAPPAHTGVANTTAARTQPFGPAAAQKVKALNQTIANLRAQLAAKQPKTTTEPGSAIDPSVANMYGLQPDYLSFISSLLGAGMPGTQTPDIGSLMSAITSGATDALGASPSSFLTPPDLSLFSALGYGY